MSRILLENHGRMANQLVAWAKAMCWRKRPETRFVLKYAPLIGQVSLSDTDIVAEQYDWPKVDVGTEPDFDCTWAAQPLWDSQPPNDEFEKWIRSIRFTPSVTQEVDALMVNGRYVGMHVRYGDYVAVDWNKPIAPLPPFIRATDDYFLGSLAIIAGVLPDRKIFLASDGTDAELKWLTDSVKAVRNRTDANPALDIYALSKCDIIIGSVSTFGHVAATYGDKPFIVPGNSMEMIRQKAEGVK